jgi:hypothetical protein
MAPKDKAITTVKHRANGDAALTHEVESVELGRLNAYGEKVDYIYTVNKDYVLYLTDTGAIRWSTNSNTRDTCLALVMARASSIKGIADEGPGLSATDNDQIVEAYITCASTGDTKAAFELLDTLKKRIIQRGTKRARLVYLSGSAVALLITILIVAFLTLLNSLADSFIFITYVAACGSLGGFLSVASGLKRINVDGQDRTRGNLLTGASRILIAIIGAVLLYFLIQGGIVLPSIAQSNSVYAIAAISVVAGFSETLVPNILRNVESQSSTSS